MPTSWTTKVKAKIQEYWDDVLNFWDDPNLYWDGIEWTNKDTIITNYDNHPFFSANYYPFLDAGTPFSRLGSYDVDSTVWTERTKP